MTARYISVLVCSLSLLSSCSSYQGGADIVPLPRTHAHNDYMHERPLYDALAAGFCSIEADVFLVDGDLFVAHDADKIKSDRTLRALYLDPLRQRVKQNGGRVYVNGPEVILLIDIKSEAEPTYKALDRILAEYGDIFTSYGPDGRSNKAVVAVVSGNRPYEFMAAQKLRYACYDGRLTDLESDAPADLICMISDNWTKYFKWNGVGEMPVEESRELRDIVQIAHAKGRLVRFWATPDKPSAARDALWRELLSAGVDLISTDDLAGLKRFLMAQRPG